MQCGHRVGCGPVMIVGNDKSTSITAFRLRHPSRTQPFRAIPEGGSEMSGSAHFEYKVVGFLPTLSSSTMTSLRNHRVIIASLFLPTTAVLGESNPPTPSIHAQGSEPSPPQLNVKHNGSSSPPFRHKPSRSLSGNQPLKSIVDDLKVPP